MERLTDEELLTYCNEYLLYEENTGLLRWKKKSGWAMTVGVEAGSMQGNGYRKVKIHKKTYLTHRIVFLMCNGHLPKNVDHKDGDKLNNKIDNLRACTQQQNCYNQKIARHNKSGVKGVHWCKSVKKWQAGIRHNRQYISLGYFDNLERAAEAVRQKRAELHGEFANHG